MVDIRTSDNRILNNGKTIIELPTNVVDVLSINQLIVVLVDKAQTDNDRNIVCYDFNGNFKWQVPEPIKLHSENYFVGIEIRETQLYAYSVSGVEYHLDPNTGSVLETQLIK